MGKPLNQLVNELKNGNMAVFELIYENTYRKVYFVVLSVLHDKSLTEDIMQDTYLKMISSIQNYTEKNFLAYLLTIAKNLAINEYNRRKKVIHSEEEIDHFRSDTLIDHLEIQAEKREVIEKTLAILEGSERDVFLLHTIENLTHREISAILDKPIGTITWLYQKAIKKIRQFIKEEYDEIPRI